MARPLYYRQTRYIIDFWKSETPFIDNHSIITATIDVSVPKFIAKPFSYLDYKSVNKNDLVAYIRSCDCLLLLFDFSKAFDSICHISPLRKLEVYGFSKPALRWIASYLTGRQQQLNERAILLYHSDPYKRECHKALSWGHFSSLYILTH